MRKYLSLVMLLCAVSTFCFTSCGKDKKASKTDNSLVQAEGEPMEGSEIATEPVNVKPEYSWKSGVSIYSQCGVFVEDFEKDGKLRWAGSLVKCQTVSVQVDGDSIKEYEMNFVNDKEGAKKTVMACLKIDNDDDVYYAVAANLVIAPACGVVVGDNISRGNTYTYLYREPDLKKVTGTKIPTGTLLAVHESNDGFVKVTFYVPEGESKGLYKERYLESSAISMDEEYVSPAQIVDRMRVIKNTNPEVAEALFSVRDNSSSDLSMFCEVIGFSSGR